ncbi:putative UDP-N-acetylglucosamine--peptide N-acetylglucosaminyltransferase SPINDLY [Planktothrix tepida]|uniref:protein O-GlcNAc transferase n=1 Tax=Planktothrix tepida PCC 9214 TaxID=671072 RepID=A0A1J1LKM1_9CYAN|nr:tetratricopeptide repeat protein [Planktothrix tepida]CAD5950621.1 putative UDP-N-acetylglucosamine--peptide N-acetylglucosaminyltransferase SPINDLY [Planktothrix tepida]CUR32578.1 Tetratricopeptide TPR_2 [Planktothrix tepida PCC 9214]
MKIINFLDLYSSIEESHDLVNNWSLLFPELQFILKLGDPENNIYLPLLLNLAVRNLENQEIYCQIGVNYVSSLMGALLNNPDSIAYVVDSFYEKDESQSYESSVEILDALNFSNQVFLCDQEPEEFLLELREVEFENQIGVCFYDWKTDYRSVLNSLLLINSFLSDQALIIVNDANHASVQQAIWDFIAATPECQVELELLPQTDEPLLFEDRIFIISRDINRTFNYQTVALLNHRQPQVIQRISQLHQFDKLLNKIYQEAVDFHQNEKFNEAENKYQEFIDFNPNHLEAWMNLGKLYYQIENYQASLHASYKLIALTPQRFDGYYQLGQCFEKLNQVEQAIAAYEKTIALKPDYLDAYNNLGNLLTQQGQFAEAETVYRQAIKINPNHFGSYLNLGNLFLLQNQFQFAKATYQKGLRIIPDQPDILHNLALTDEIEKNPIPYYRSFGDRLYELGNYEGAITEYQKILNLQAGDVDLYEKLNHCYWQLNQPNDAIDILKIGTKIYPDFAPLHFTLIMNLLYQGRTEEAVKQAELASEYLPKDYTFTLLKHLIVPMLYHSVEEINNYRERFNQGLQNLIATTDLNDPETLEQSFLGMGRFTNFYLGYQARNVVEEQRIYGHFLYQIMSKKYPQWVQTLTLPPVEDKIRVGYVSSYLHCYSGSLWLIGWLRYANRDQFEIYAYYTGNSPDPVTEKFRQYSHKFYHIPNNLEAVAEQIIKDQLHILVYPEIGMNPPTMELAALRLAPIQCTAWGHPVTSGLPTIDYFLSSQLMEPENAQKHYSEALILLPNIGVAYPKPQDIPPLVKTRLDYNLPEDTVIYLCCQAPFKYLPQYDYILPEIAIKVPNAKFLFFRGTLLNDRLNQAFSNYGLNYQDYCLHRKVDERFDYLMLNQLSDVFLDTFTWSGGNTSLEAIACYLPIVTCPGEFMRGRHADSFLKMMGLTETIAKNEAEYIEIAVKLGLDSIWRETISQQMGERQNLLFDDQVCVTALEEFYQAVTKARLS